MNIIDKWLKEKGSNLIAKFVEQEALDLLISEVKRLEAENVKLKLLQSSLQLRNKSKSFLNIKTLADLRLLYPKQSSYRIKRDGEFLHYFVNNKLVFTKALIV